MTTTTFVSGLTNYDVLAEQKAQDLATLIQKSPEKYPETSATMKAYLRLQGIVDSVRADTRTRTISPADAFARFVPEDPENPGHVAGGLSLYEAQWLKLLTPADFAEWFSQIADLEAPAETDECSFGFGVWQGLTKKQWQFMTHVTQAEAGLKTPEPSLHPVDLSASSKVVVTAEGAFFADGDGVYSLVKGDPAHQLPAGTRIVKNADGSYHVETPQSGRAAPVFEHQSAGAKFHALVAEILHWLRHPTL